MKTAYLSMSLAMALGMAMAAGMAGNAMAQTQTAPVSVTQTQHSLDSFQPQIQEAEAYLNGLRTAKARFLLTAADGSQQIGTFYLNRPGKLRFEYDPPLKDFIVADGLLIYFYDSQLGEQSNAPIGQTMADFLLRKDIRLNGDLTVERVMRGGDLLQITLTQKSDPGAGSLTLGLSENPMQLKKWRIVDAHGQTVEVELFQLETGMKLDPKLFVYHAPKGPKKYND